MLKNNLDSVKQRIEEACKRVGRDPNEVTLIAVSKTKPLSDIEELITYGVHEFGENKVQELSDKFDHISQPVHWHQIGHLQTNKVKYLMNKVSLIHSVDSLRLARQIQTEAQKQQIVVPILIQVNIANEETKFGLSKNEVVPLLSQINSFQNIKVTGLMTIAPFVENPEDNRIHFANMHNLLLDIQKQNIDNVDMNILSMGMTNDYEIAIEEGSTMVRVGTGIFGERNYLI